MSNIDFLKELQKNNFSNTPLGNIFVEDVVSMSEDDYLDKLEGYYKSLTDFNTDNKWYLPFDVSSYLQIIQVDNGTGRGMKPSVVVATFYNNHESKLSSTLKFTCIVDNIGVIKGNLAIRKVADIDSAYINSLTEQARAADYLFCIVDIRLPKSGEKLKSHVLFLNVENCVFKREDTKKISLRRFRFTDSADQRLHSYMSQYASVLLNGFCYFTNMIIDPNLFIIEEKLAKKVNNTVKVFAKHPSLFRTMTIRDIRSKYIKAETNSSGSKLEIGHERCRHTRTFRSDYYKNRKGETIIIEPTWVGPIESYDPQRKRMYTVRLDLGYKRKNIETGDTPNGEKSGSSNA